MRRYAEDTSVPVARSRGEIDSLLRDWGAVGIQWTDEFDQDRVTLRFVWPHDDVRYTARVSVKLPSRASLEEQAIDGRSTWRKEVSKTKLAALMEARGRREHRLLLLWLKAALNAVDAQVVAAEEVFLPFLEGADGRTVGEVAVPKMHTLLRVSADRLLSAPRTEDKP
jgi:hypothetical protein